MAPDADEPTLWTDPDDLFLADRRARTGAGAGGGYLATTGGQSGWGYFGVDPQEPVTVRADATTREREVLMAVRHREKTHVGVQFHPERILAGSLAERGLGDPLDRSVGKRMVENFLAGCSDG